MTTQKLFKRRVRERMAKTGERYATARRQVAERRGRLAPAAIDPDLLAAAVDLAADATLAEATGRGWEGWIAILDRWGARDRKHGETAAYLQAEHGVPGWWAQTITGGYERARGMRRKHQQADGYTISASKTIGVPLDVLFDAFVGEGIRRTWLHDGQLSTRSARPGKSARFDWDGGPSRLLVTFEAKGPVKATVVVSHERLPDPEAAEQAKSAWRARLAELKVALESTDG